ncbi:tetratricopeptide repeat protein [Halobellus sp. Atlit-31R]|nr:tetratricopeptide repeat protein [Halobellus sp. Atlit-31R]
MELARWAFALLGTGDVTSAIEIFRVATELYPTSGNAFEALASALARNGDKEQAIQTYRRAMSLDPSNDNPRKQIEILEASAAKGTPNKAS